MLFIASNMPFLPMFKKRKLSPMELNLSENGEINVNDSINSPTTASTVSIDLDENGEPREQDGCTPSLSTITLNFDENGEPQEQDDSIPSTATISVNFDENGEPYESHKGEDSVLFSQESTKDAQYSQFQDDEYINRLTNRSPQNSPENFWSALLDNNGTLDSIIENSTTNEHCSDVQQETLSSPKPICRRKSYTAEDKLKYIYAMREKSLSLTKASHVFQIPKRNLQRWLAQEDELKKVRDSPDNVLRLRRKIQTVRKPRHPELENQLLNQFYKRRDLGLRVSLKWFRETGVDIARDLSIQNFIVSNGYIAKFLSRNNITLRTGTSAGQKLPENAKTLALNFMSNFETIRQKFIGSYIIYANMDEVPVWIDMPSNHTYEMRGQSSVKMSTTGHEKTRFTVVLATLSNGEKLKPMIINKCANEDKEEFIGNVYVTGAKGGSMNDNLMNRWLKKCWKNRPNGILDNLSNSITKRRTVLIMDSFPCHKNPECIRDLDLSFNTETAIIPGGLTKVLQPADVSYNKTFKQNMRELWEDWMENGRKEYTNRGNRKHANRFEIADWVERAWETVPVDIIKKSYVCCGVTDVDSPSLNHKLLDLITEKPFEYDDNDSHSGLTDVEETDMDA